MIRAAEAMHGPKAAERFPGLQGEARVKDWAALIAAKDDLVWTLREKKYADLLPGYENITYIDEGSARLVDGGVEVGGRKINASKVIVATGGRPAVPDIAGICLARGVNPRIRTCVQECWAHAFELPYQR